MKLLLTLILGALLYNLAGCCSTQNLQKQVPFNIERVYYQKRVAGIKGGGSVINLFVVLKDDLPKSIQVDRVYFNGDVANLEAKGNTPKIFVGQFKSKDNQEKDVEMNRNPSAEYGNQIPKNLQAMLFELHDNECVIRYKDNGQIKYFKVQNVVEKQAVYLPSAPQN